VVGAVGEAVGAVGVVAEAVRAVGEAVQAAAAEEPYTAPVSHLRPTLTLSTFTRATLPSLCG